MDKGFENMAYGLLGLPHAGYKNPEEAVGRLDSIGIKLIVTEIETNKEVNYGVQINNTTLEIEALPNLKVDVVGYSAMYEALENSNKVLEFIRDKSGFEDGSIGKLQCDRAIAVNRQALAEGRS